MSLHRLPSPTESFTTSRIDLAHYNNERSTSFVFNISKHRSKMNLDIKQLRAECAIWMIGLKRPPNALWSFFSPYSIRGTIPRIQIMSDSKLYPPNRLPFPVYIAPTSPSVAQGRSIHCDKVSCRTFSTSFSRFTIPSSPPATFFIYCQRILASFSGSHRARWKHWHRS